MVDRPNLLIKIPATLEGLPAIRQTIAAGINVNVTLIFSLARYQQVMDAYLIRPGRPPGERAAGGSDCFGGFFFRIPNRQKGGCS